MNFKLKKPGQIIPRFFRCNHCKNVFLTPEQRSTFTFYLPENYFRNINEISEKIKFCPICKKGKLKEKKLPPETQPIYKSLIAALKYIDKKYKIKKLYYPGSEWDLSPILALGDDKVYHLDVDRISFGYFKAKHKFIGTFLHTIFPNDFFDAALIHHIGAGDKKKDEQMIKETIRVVKNGGLLIVDTFIPLYKKNKKIFKQFKDITPLFMKLNIFHPLKIFKILK